MSLFTVYAPSTINDQRVESCQYDFIISSGSSVAVVIYAMIKPVYFVLNFLVQCKAHAKRYTCFVSRI